MLFWILKKLTQKTLDRYNPIVIGITGSVGKTGTKEAIYAVLHRKYFVRKSPANLNNQIGVPCAVLGITPAGSKEKKATWRSRLTLLGGIIKAKWYAYGPMNKTFPRVLVLELGADRPGDIDYLVDMVKPRVAVVTAVGDMPVHVEFYDSPEAVAKEKSKIMRYLPEDGLAVLNHDDPVVMHMNLPKTQLATFGFDDLADFWVSDVAYYLAENNRDIEGLSFKLHKGVGFIPVKIPGFVAAHQVYAILAAFAVGDYFGMNLVEIAGGLEELELPAKRLHVLAGINDSYILDDTYNASPLSTAGALESLSDYGKTIHKIHHKGGRKIAVLGDMRELGDFAQKAHEQIGKKAKETCDVIITVGEMGKIISTENNFATAQEALAKLKEIIGPLDVVLIKGSRAMHMEEIVEGLKKS